MLKKYLIGTFAVAMFAFVATTASAYDFGTTTLKVGSKGEAVKTLQTLVGATPADGIFGKMTAAKVKVWQAANGLTADGVFGKMSMAKANMTAGGTTTGSTCPTGYVATTPVAPLFASCVASTTTPTTPSTLAGVSGEIAEFNTLSQYNNTEVGAGQKDVKVYGAEVKATKEGDIELKSTKVSFVISNTSGSTKLADYVGSVAVWMGSTQVGSANAADFTKDSTGHYSKTIVISSGVVKADAKEKMYVSVTPLSNLDSGDIDSETVTFGIDNVRYVDGAGVTTTEATTGDLPVSGVSVKFVDFSTSSDTELKISTDSTPTAGILKVSSTNDTKGVVLLKGKMKLEGTSKVWFDEMPVTFTATGATAIDALTGTVYLTIGGNTYSESTGANCVSTCASNNSAVVTFDNLNLNLDAGSTTTFVVSADINDIEDSATASIDFDEGDSLTASLTTTNRAAIVAENEAGDQLVNSTEMTGSATGNAQQFFSTSVNVVMGTSTITPTTNSTTGEVTAIAYSIPLTVTSFGNTLYMGQTAQNSATVSGSNAFAFVFQDSANPTTSITTSVTVSGITLETTDATIDTNGYTLNEGETKHFTLKATLLTRENNTSYRIQVKQAQTFTESTLLTGTALSLSPDVNFRTGFQLLNN